MGYRLKYEKDGQEKSVYCKTYYEAVRGKNQLAKKGHSVELVETGVDRTGKHYVFAENKTDKQLVAEAITRFDKIARYKMNQTERIRRMNQKAYEKRKARNGQFNRAS